MADKVSIFSEPEVIDAVIKTKLAQFPRKGGKIPSKKARWDESELELIDGVIFDYITTQCLSRERTAQQLSERWGIGMSTARMYVKDSIERLAKRYEVDTDKMKKTFLERCESIIQDAIESKQKDAALRAMDMMAKSLGFYQDKKDVTINGGDTPIKFEFGE